MARILVQLNANNLNPQLLEFPAKGLNTRLISLRFASYSIFTVILTPVILTPVILNPVILTPITQNLNNSKPW